MEKKTNFRAFFEDCTENCLLITDKHYTNEKAIETIEKKMNSV